MLAPLFVYLQIDVLVFKRYFWQIVDRNVWVLVKDSDNCSLEGWLQVISNDYLHKDISANIRENSAIQALGCLRTYSCFEPTQHPTVHKTQSVQGSCSSDYMDTILAYPTEDSWNCLSSSTCTAQGPSLAFAGKPRSQTWKFWEGQRQPVLKPWFPDVIRRGVASGKTTTGSPASSFTMSCPRAEKKSKKIWQTRKWPPLERLSWEEADHPCSQRKQTCKSQIVLLDHSKLARYAALLYQRKRWTANKWCFTHTAWNLSHFAFCMVSLRAQSLGPFYLYYTQSHLTTFLTAAQYVITHLQMIPRCGTLALLTNLIQPLQLCKNVFLMLSPGWLWTGCNWMTERRKQCLLCLKEHLPQDLFLSQYA